MNRMPVAIVLATVLALGPLGAALAQSLSPQDQAFLIEAARGGMAAVELGRLASHRAASDAARQFGERMAREHDAANQELLALAQRKGVALPREVDAAHRATIDRLATLSGPAFDQAYVTEMMKDHREHAALFARQAQAAQDPELRAWTAKMLRTIDEHHRVAQDVHARLARTPIPPAAAVAPPPRPAPAVPPVTVVPPAPAASPATVTTVVTTVTPAPPFCGGTYLPGVGTNFAACPR